MKFDVTPLENALKQLQLGLVHPPANDLERDGVIQRFEYCFELSWKTIRSLLLKAGRAEVSGSPRPLFREAMSEGLIDRFEVWDEFLGARNESAHTYHVKTAEQVYDCAKRFPSEALQLLAKLRAYATKAGI